MCDEQMIMHEFVGVVTEIGEKVQKFKIDDKVGVGCLIGSCRQCDSCANDLEIYCLEQLQTYSTTYYDGTITYGGYSGIMVANENYVVRWPENLPMEVAPLLCAGITIYSPLRFYGLYKPGMHVGVDGLGRLGHMAVKFGKAFGAKVTIISTSISKKDEAIEGLGADAFLVSKDQEQIQAAANTMDGIIDTISATHPYGWWPRKASGTAYLAFLLIGRKMVGGSAIGGIKETQEMVDFAAKNNITSDVEIIPVDYINRHGAFIKI